MQIAVVLGLLVLAILLFALERVSVDLITLLLLSALLLSGILTPEEAFSGFSSEIVIIIAAIFVISSALLQTGVMDLVGKKIYSIAGQNPVKLTAMMMMVVASVSAFMNNTTVTAVFVPAVLGLARRAKMAASKLLIPLAYASMLGGTCTVIGTSTNVAVAGMMKKFDLEPFALFEFLPIGILIVAVGTAYMVTWGRKLLPDHREVGLTEDYHVKEYLTEVVVLPQSPLLGQHLGSFRWDGDVDLTVLGIIRGKEAILAPRATEVLKAHDVLLVEGRIEDIARVKEISGIEIKADLKFSDEELESDRVRLVEVIIPPTSALIGNTLKEINFRRRYGLTALAIYRHGESLRDRVARIRLQLGDLLLVQGRQENIDLLKRERDLWVLEEVTHFRLRRSKGLYTMGFFLAALGATWLNIVPLPVAILLAAILIILTRCITVEEAYKSLDLRLIVLIGGMTSFGIAMEKTGAAEFLAAHIAHSLAPLGIPVVMAGLFLLTVLLTQPMSNAAAALVVLPVAVSTAVQLGVNPRTFAMAIALAASCSFVTPLEPSCILVYGPGKYRFADFIRSGFWLTLILFVIILIFVPMFWPL
ncbi:MAG: SLC13 family permease [Acidobacteria bacterium]|nr:SLC13 family permease [Acidobacteriota bacterium]